MTTANTGDVLTYGGSDYQWSSPSSVLTNNSVVRGLVTGAGNTTLRLVMTDSSTIDIECHTSVLMKTSTLGLSIF